MKKKNFIAKVVGAASAVGASITLGLTNVHAQNNWLPKFLSDLLTGDILFTSENLVRAFFVLMIGFFMVVIIYTVLQRMIQYSRDEGKEIKEASKEIQKQLMLVASVFISVMGLALVFIFFGQRLIFPDQICIDSPNSFGCFACDRVEKDDDDFDRVCNVCNADRDYILFQHTYVGNPAEVEDEVAVDDHANEDIDCRYPKNEVTERFLKEEDKTSKGLEMYLKQQVGIVDKGKVRDELGDYF